MLRAAARPSVPVPALACYSPGQGAIRGSDLGQRTWQEGDIKAGVQNGGGLVGVFVVCRENGRGRGFIPYIRTDWARGFRPLRTYRDRSDRVFRSLDKLVALVRDEFGYRGEISLFMAGDAALQRFRTLLPPDRDGVAATAADGPEPLPEASEPDAC